MRQLLAFSRRQTLTPTVLDLTDVLTELANLVRRLIGEKIDLKIVHGRDLWHVRADQGQLEQVIVNLAVNARVAMAEGGTLTVRTETVRHEDSGVLSDDTMALVRRLCLQGRLRHGYASPEERAAAKALRAERQAAKPAKAARKAKAGGRKPSAKAA